MKVTFKAKDIQNIIEFSKSRYEYLGTKIGISPDIEEVEGTGRSHRYSFKNLLQFAFIHYASDLGLTPKASKAMLSALERFNEKVEANQFLRHALVEHNIIDARSPQLENGEFGTFSAFFGFYCQNEDFGYELNFIRKLNKFMFLLKTDYKDFFYNKKSKYISMHHGAIYWTDDDDKVRFHEIIGDDDSSDAIIEKIFEGALGYITINLGEIKRQILSKTK